MAFNIFNATMDVLDNNQRTYDASYNRTDKAFKDVAARKAGMALAAGDRQGAMQAMGGEGEVDAVRQMQLDQGREDQQAYSNKRQEGLDADKKRADLAAALQEAFQHVAELKTPQERREAMKHPVWQMAGIKPEMVDALPDSDFEDAGVEQFREALKRTVHNLGGGGLAETTNRGGFRTLREPTEKAPPGFEFGPDGSLHPIPGYVAGRAAIAGATRAPPRPRAAPAGAPAAGPSTGGVYTGPVTWGGSK